MSGMLWVGRLFEERYTALRLTVVALTGVGYLTLVPEGSALGAADRWTAIGVILLSYVGVWSPLTAVCIVAAARAGAQLVGAGDETISTVALAWAMFELGARRAGPQTGVGLAAGLAGSLLSDLGELAARPLSMLFGCGSAVAGPLVVGLYVRALHELNHRAAADAARELSRVRAEERTAIARELHDLVAHHVASIVLRVAVARNVLPLADPRVREVLDDVHATGAGALADLRRLVTVLRDPGSAQTAALVDPAGLPLALAAVVGRSHQIGLTVRADIDPAVAGLDARTALAVLRLTQEGLANVAKHAGTVARADLSIRLAADTVEFDLRDSGGPVTAHGAGGDGHGLVGLRERVEILGGRLRAGPAGGGWHLTATVPAPAAPTA